MKFHDVEQNTPEWDSLRLGRITASNYSKFMANYGAAFGEPAHRYALQVALERVTGLKAEYSFKNEHMERGTEQEPVARMLYEEATFTEVKNGGFFDCGDWGDSPDGLVDDDGVTEIKSVIASTHEATIKRGAADPAYRWQIVGHLEATGRDWVDFVSYCSDYPEWNRLVVYRTHKKDVSEDIERLVERRAKFIDLVRDKVVELNKKAA